MPAAAAAATTFNLAIGAQERGGDERPQPAVATAGYVSPGVRRDGGILY